MNFIYRLFLLSMAFSGCDSYENRNIPKDQLKQNSSELLIEPDTIYNIELANKLWEKLDTVKAVVIDTACIRQRQRAKTDIQNGKLIFYHSKIWYEWKEMAELLSKFNVEYEDYEHFCFGPPPGFEHDCYEKTMRDAIYDKIGEKEIDSLWNLAEKMFVLKYPDSVYMKEGIDIRTKYLDE